jgi:hypothetical protein
MNYFLNSYSLLIVVYLAAILILYCLFGGAVAALGGLVLAGGYVAYHFFKKVKNEP